MGGVKGSDLATISCRINVFRLIYIEQRYDIIYLESVYIYNIP